MNSWSILPGQPPHPSNTPMVYVNRELGWEYKVIIRDLEKKAALNEEELNKLGAEGWEMTGILQQPPLTYFYFKRQVEK